MLRRALGASRRSVLTIGAAATAAALTRGVGTAWAAPPGAPLADRQRATLFLDVMMDAHTPSGELGLPQSYSDQVGLYTTAFTYDAALTVLAYLLDERPASADRARRIGEALVYAQQHDPYVNDGRLRQAYAVGPYTRDDVEQPDGLVHPNGTVNIGGPFEFTGSGTGEQAWAGLALCGLFRDTGDGEFLGAAVRLGEWVVRVASSPGRLGGFTDGLDRIGTPIGLVSTARNAELVAFFGQLADLTGDRTWQTHRDEARRFVAAMWNPVQQAFAAVSDGVTIDRGQLILEAQTHAWLALRDLNHIGCLHYVARHLMATDTAARPNSTLIGSQQFTGVTFSAASLAADPAIPIEPGLPKPDPNAVWFEGTAQYACALHNSSAGALDSSNQLQTLTAAQAQLGAGQTVADQPLPPGAGVVATTSPLRVGAAGSGYYPARHVAATAWYLLAAAGTNPLR